MSLKTPQLNQTAPGYAARKAEDFTQEPHIMTEIIPADIQADLEKAAALHQRTSADYHKCLEFNKLMSDILARLEDAGCTIAPF
jgi:hypothetical protein